MSLVDAAQPPSPRASSDDDALPLTVRDIRQARTELALLDRHHRSLARLRRQNQAHQHTLARSLAALRRSYDDLRHCLAWLDRADRYDLEDHAQEVVRLDEKLERHAIRCPFDAQAIRNIPLLRLHAVERAEFDNLVAGSPWSEMEDRRLVNGVVAAARRQFAIDLRNDARFQRDPLRAAAEASQEELVARYADRAPLRQNGSDDDDHDYARIDWTLVASHVATRHPQECRTRWIQARRPGVDSRSPWSADELRRLQSLVADHVAAHPDRQAHRSAIPWTRIAERLATRRTGYACLVAYARLAPSGPSTFTPAEDASLRALVELFGGSWKLVSLHHPRARGSAPLYRRFVRSLDPSMTRGKWSAEEDQALVATVAELGQGDWTTIASRVPGRTPGQCRDRFKNRIETRLVVAARAAAAGTAVGEGGDGTSTQVQAPPEPKVKRVWTEEETETLRSLLCQGTMLLPKGKRWIDVAEELSNATQGRVMVSAKQARDRAEAVRKAKKQRQRAPAAALAAATTTTEATPATTTTATGTTGTAIPHPPSTEPPRTHPTSCATSQHPLMPDTASTCAPPAAPPGKRKRGRPRKSTAPVPAPNTGTDANTGTDTNAAKANAGTDANAGSDTNAATDEAPQAKRRRTAQ
ncbi:hypothetical protein ACQY0O_007491 [Thecaphora frezii]